MPDIDFALLVGATFLIAGTVKGIVGFGMPTVTLALLAATIGLKPAIAVTVFPTLTTNIWQALAGGLFWASVKRLWPMLVMIVAGIYIGTLGLVWIDPRLLTVFLGCLVVIYALTGLLDLTVPSVGRHESWASVVMGLINGTVTGLTGTFIVPGVLYLQTLAMPRVQLIQAMGIVFCLSTAVLGLFLTRVNLMSQDLALTSAIGIVPAFAGMWLGQKIRGNLSEKGFKRAFFVGLLLVGGFLVARNVPGLGSAIAG